MIKILLLTAVAIYGLLYAANPKKFLERRGDREITPEMLRTARTVGILITAASAAVLVMTLIRGRKETPWQGRTDGRLTNYAR